MSLDLRAALEKRLIEASASESVRAQFAALSDSQIQSYVHSMDDSSYSFDQWLEAVTHFQDWLPKDADYGLNDQIEYLICAVEGTMQTGSLLPLKDVLSHYLKTEGVEKLGL